MLLSRSRGANDVDTSDVYLRICYMCTVSPGPRCHVINMSWLDPPIAHTWRVSIPEHTYTIEFKLSSDHDYVYSGISAWDNGNARKLLPIPTASVGRAHLCSWPLVLVFANQGYVTLSKLYSEIGQLRGGIYRLEALLAHKTSFQRSDV